MMRGFLLPLLFGWILPYPLLGQLTPSEELETLKAKYPNESAVTTNYWREVDIRVVEDSLEIVVEQYREQLILSNPKRWGKDRVFSNSFRPLKDIEAYTLIPTGKKYKKAEVTEFPRSFDKESYVFFDDTEIVHYTYPQVDVGCKVVTRNSWRVTDPRLLGQFFFQSYEPIVQARLTIEFPEEVTIIPSLFGNLERFLISQEAEDLREDRKRLVYGAEHLPAIQFEDDGPPFAQLSASLYPRIGAFRRSDGTEVRVLATLDDLHDWYRQFLHHVDTGASLKQMTAEIVDGDDTEWEKIRKIFYWVQRNVRYVAFEQGMRGFVPHSPDYVLDKRYGDCKDMSCLLVGLLRTEGIDAYFTWVGTRDLPYKYQELPSPLVDNHMIAAVQYGDSTMFLDATGSYMPLGYPTSMIQGKEALISLGDDYEIRQVPIVPKEQNTIIDSVFVSLADGQLTGSGRMSITGLARAEQSQHLVDRRVDGTEEYAKGLLTKGSNKFFLDRYDISDIESLDEPIRLSYDFRVEDYYREIGDELYINLCLDKRMIDGLIKDRQTPLENDHKYLHRTVTILDLPANMEVSYRPDDEQWSNGDFGFQLTYQQNDRRLVVTKEYFVDFLQLPIERFEEWNEGIQAYAKAARNSVVLKQVVE